MIKTIIKELIIMLLLCLTIILVLGVLLYGYVPTNKIIPEKVSYTVPENIKEELEKTLSSDNLEVILTYEVDSADLNNYEKINKLNTGKPNPFSSYEKQETQAENTTTSNSSTTNNTSSNTTTSTTTSEQTTNESAYVKNTGTK